MAEAPDPGPPEDYKAAFQLVGEFMWHWSTLEIGLDRAVKAVLSLGSLEGAILTANLQVRDKIHTAKTGIALFGPKDDAFTSRTTRLFDKIAKAATDRNLVAHNFFAPEGGNIAFRLTKAKGSLSLDDAIWRPTDFKLKYQKMNRLESALDKLVEETVTAKARFDDAPPRGLVNSLFRPLTAPSAEGAWDNQLLQALSGLDSSDDARAAQTLEPPPR